MKIHSTVSLITNSSSELFVCDTQLSVEDVQARLVELLDFYYTFTGKEYDTTEEAMFKVSRNLDEYEYYDSNAILIEERWCYTMPRGIRGMIVDAFNAKHYRGM